MLKDLRQLRLLDTSMQLPLDQGHYATSLNKYVDTLAVAHICEEHMFSLCLSIVQLRSYTLAAGPKVLENDDGMGIATIGVLYLGCVIN